MQSLLQTHQIKYLLSGGRDVVMKSHIINHGSLERNQSPSLLSFLPHHSAMETSLLSFKVDTLW